MQGGLRHLSWPTTIPVAPDINLSCQLCSYLWGLPRIMIAISLFVLYTFSEEWQRENKVNADCLLIWTLHMMYIKVLNDESMIIIAVITLIILTATKLRSMHQSKSHRDVSFSEFFCYQSLKPHKILLGFAFSKSQKLVSRARKSWL